MFQNEKSFYFVGIGGVSMSALAKLVRDRGYSVRGSDRVESERTKMLRKSGIPVSIGEDEKIVEDAVVFTGAVDPNNPQLLFARREKKSVYSRAEFLGEIAKSFSHTVAVAGCHGKTTTVSMLSHIFLCAGKEFTCHIGGEDLALGNYYRRGDEYFLTEACEFQRSFLSIESEIALILNTDLDHTDCYKDEEEVFSAYRAFAARAKKLIVNSDDVRARTLRADLSFGLGEGDIRAEELSAVGERYSFTATEKGIPLVRIKLCCVGKVMIYDALAAFAAARLMGFTAEEIKRGLEDFRGVGRRFESMGTIGGIPVVCDYAHHPKEIAAVIDTAKKICNGKVRVVFQPHTYTRTKDFMEEFVSVLDKTSPVVYKTFAAREPFSAEGSAYALVSKLKEGIYVQTPRQLKKRLLELAKEEDLILVLGAGDIYWIVKSILD